MTDTGDVPDGLPDFDHHSGLFKNYTEGRYRQALLTLSR